MRKGGKSFTAACLLGEPAVSLIRGDVKIPKMWSPTCC